MPKESKIVDIHTYLPVIMELTEQGQTVSLTITGNSMTPFLVHGRDQIRFQKPTRPLKRGDMAFFRRRNGDYIMHRICRVDDDGNYYLVGDGQQVIEGPIAPSQIFGHVIQVCRKGKWLGPGNFWWEFFAHTWLTLLPWRSFLCKAYGFIRPKGGRTHDGTNE